MTTGDQPRRPLVLDYWTRNNSITFLPNRMLLDPYSGYRLPRACPVVGRTPIPAWGEHNCEGFELLTHLSSYIERKGSR